MYLENKDSEWTLQYGNSQLHQAEPSDILGCPCGVQGPRGAALPQLAGVSSDLDKSSILIFKAKKLLPSKAGPSAVGGGAVTVLQLLQGWVSLGPTARLCAGALAGPERWRFKGTHLSRWAPERVCRAAAGEAVLLSVPESHLALWPVRALRVLVKGTPSKLTGPEFNLLRHPIETDQPRV